MNTSGVRTPGSSTTTIINSGTQRTVARFDLTGTVGDTYSITLPSSISVSVETGTGDKNMEIDALVIKVDGAAETSNFSGIHTLAGGASHFLLGGTLNISETQEIGVYSGTYDVTVDYN
jgi:hypothetical protein